MSYTAVLVDVTAASPPASPSSALTLLLRGGNDHGAALPAVPRRLRRFSRRRGGRWRGGGVRKWDPTSS